MVPAYTASMPGIADQLPASRIPNRWTVAEWNALDPAQRRLIIDTAPTLRRTTFNDQTGKDGIQWAAWSWNPVNGCDHGCTYCYARAITERFAGTPAFPAEIGFAPVFIPDRLHAPRHTRVPASVADDPAQRNVFLGSMSDLFGRWVPQDWIDAIFAEITISPQWRFLTLTKFPQRLAEQAWPGNVWAGASVDRQARASTAVRAFSGVRAGLRWLSCEPMLEPLRFESLAMFDLIVIGGQTAQPAHGVPTFYPPTAWVDALVAQAQNAGCLVFVKDNTAPGGRGDWPRDLPWEVGR